MMTMAMICHFERFQDISIIIRYTKGVINGENHSVMQEYIYVTERYTNAIIQCLEYVDKRKSCKEQLTVMLFEINPKF